MYMMCLSGLHSQCAQVRQRLPYYRRFVNGWPVKDVVSRFLQNRAFRVKRDMGSKNHDSAQRSLMITLHAEPNEAHQPLGTRKIMDYQGRIFT
jgi:hypothetical protein